MPIKVKGDLPAKAVIESENIFIMDETRAIRQDIRPLKIAILNLMPLKHETEIQLLRALSNTPLQVDVTFVHIASHISKNTPASHLNQFYSSFDEIKHKKFDGFIITGAPLDDYAFEEVTYWEEMKEIMDFTEKNVTSTLHICWGALAGLYYHYGIPIRRTEQKRFGIFEHKVIHRKVPLMRGFDDVFLAPHSRHIESIFEDIRTNENLNVLADSDVVGPTVIIAEEGKQIFLMGHPEYDRMTLDIEYKRDLAKGLPIQLPYNYYPDDNPENPPLLTWRAHANALYTNWLNYYVYQITPYDIEKID
ncbi:MAG: homoserine O-succinyltransferase [Lachnospiraceae bacterium]|nr:homoserine O-succinyltransferase [Lachnospiraceae bacterium]